MNDKAFFFPFSNCYFIFYNSSQLFHWRRWYYRAPNVVQTPEPVPPAPTQYSLTVSSGEGGTASTEGGTYDEGTEVTITVSPSEGYRFTGWEGNDSTSESLTITLNSNQTYQALFEPIPIGECIGGNNYDYDCDGRADSEDYRPKDPSSSLSSKLKRKY